MSKKFAALLLGNVPKQSVQIVRFWRIFDEIARCVVDYTPCNCVKTAFKIATIYSHNLFSHSFLVYIICISLELLASGPIDPMGYFYYSSTLEKYSIDDDWNTIAEKLDIFHILNSSNSAIEISDSIGIAQEFLTFISQKNLKEDTQKYRVKNELSNLLKKYLSNERVIELQISEKRKEISKSSETKTYEIILDFPIYILRTISCLSPDKSEIEKIFKTIGEVKDKECKEKYILSFLDALTRFSPHVFTDEEFNRRTRDCTSQVLPAIKKLRFDIHIKRNGIRKTIKELSNDFLHTETIASDRDITCFFRNHISYYYLSTASRNPTQKEELLNLLKDNASSETEKLLAMYMLMQYHNCAKDVIMVNPFEYKSHHSENENLNRLYKFVCRMLMAYKSGI
ncbi:MAG: hypothetical protein IJJ26_05510 [Victivallales bacterium]|nr:hypothetical protein [Victivallales bacterium]